MNQNRLFRENGKSLLTLAIVTLLLLTSCVVMTNGSESEATTSMQSEMALSEQMIADISESELIDVYLWLIANAGTIDVFVDEDGILRAEVYNPQIVPFGGKTGVSTYHEGIIIKLNSDACDMLLAAGSGAAGSA